MAREMVRYLKELKRETGSLLAVHERGVNLVADDLVDRGGEAVVGAGYGDVAGPRGGADLRPWTDFDVGGDRVARHEECHLALRGFDCLRPQKRVLVHDLVACLRDVM